MKNTIQILKVQPAPLKGLIVALCAFGIIKAMTVDERFFVPFLERNPLMGEQKTCAISLQPYALLADKSYDERGEECPLFAYDGDTYGIRYLDDAIVLSGRRDTSLLKTEWQREILEGPYVMRGRMVGQGLALNAYFAPRSWWGFGARTGLLNIDSNMELVRDVSRFEPVVHGLGQEQELIALQGDVHNALDIASTCWQGAGFSDTELFVRACMNREYQYMCRYFSLGFELGAVLPTGRKRDVNNPASLRFGGVNFGLYAEGSVEVLLKRDIWFFCFARAQRRLGGALIEERMSVDKEPWRFGALVGSFSVDPGFTFALAPWLLFEGMRDGLGFRVGYTLVTHSKDAVHCADWAPAEAGKGPVLERYSEASSWGAERIHVGVLYDFSRGKKIRSWEPVIAATVDVPTAWFVAKRSFKTVGLSVSLESSF